MIKRYLPIKLTKSLFACSFSLFLLNYCATYLTEEPLNNILYCWLILETTIFPLTSYSRKKKGERKRENLKQRNVLIEVNGPKESRIYTSKSLLEI